MSIFQLGPSPSHSLCEPQFPPLNYFSADYIKTTFCCLPLRTLVDNTLYQLGKINLVALNCRHTGGLDIRAWGPAFPYPRKGLALDLCMSCFSWTFRSLLNAFIWEMTSTTSLSKSATLFLSYQGLCNPSYTLGALKILRPGSDPWWVLA